jgi:hypothetical protein
MVGIQSGKRDACLLSRLKRPLVLDWQSRAGLLEDQRRSSSNVLDNRFPLKRAAPPRREIA